MLVVENLRVSYGRIRALHGINFSIDEGEIVCIIGANGAGKSTSLRAISRMVPVESGTRMIYKDEDLLKYPADKVVSKLGISHVPEGRRILDNLTVMENLKLATFARKDGAHKIEVDLERVFSIFPRLEERRNQKGGTLSGGEQQMLALGRGLMSRPRLLMVDEPFLGLAPGVVQEMKDAFQRVNDEGVSILFIEQNVQVALNMSSRGYILESGRLALAGASADLLNSTEVKRIFLGG